MKKLDTLIHKLLYGAYGLTFISMLVALVLGGMQNNGEMLLYAAATIVVLLLLLLLRRFFQIPPVLELLIVLFIFASITLAKLFDFYTRIPSWDLILHGFSGPLISAIGIALLGLWRFEGQGTKILSASFVAIFGFLFSMTVAGLWEFYEFGFDTFFGTQMQKYTFLQNGMIDTGLYDTMTDMLSAAVGSLLYALLTYFDIKFGGSKLTNNTYLHRNVN